MNRTIYQTHPVDSTGWTDWISPIHGTTKHNYKIKCCDCDLVHDMQFRVQKRKINGTLKNCVVYKVKRNNRATAAGRRNKHAPRTFSNIIQKTSERCQ